MMLNGCGCIFDHYGRVPEEAYHADGFQSPLEEAVFSNDLQLFNKLVQDGHEVSIRLKVGQMSCVEYAAMMGYTDILQALIKHSINADMLNVYFSQDDVVERAYVISKNKTVFFQQAALAEVNRYEAALYTAVEYNQADCVGVLLAYMGRKEPGRHRFLRQDSNEYDSLSVIELAEARGHTECFELLTKKIAIRAQ